MDHEILELQRLYAERLPGKITEIDAAWRKIPRDGFDAVALEEVQRHAHYLAGSGATFGFPGVSEAAGKMERLVEDMAPGGGPPSAELRAQFEEFLAVLTAQKAGAE